MKTIIILPLLSLSLLAGPGDRKQVKLEWDHSLNWPDCTYRIYEKVGTNYVELARDITNSFWNLPAGLTGTRTFVATAANLVAESVPSNEATANLDQPLPPGRFKFTVTMEIP